MATISVKLESSYGSDCCGCGYGSNDNITVEISDIELTALRRIGADNIKRDAVVAAIENGETVLQALSDKLDEACFYMEENYWLFEADNECLVYSLSEAFESDIENGVYEQMSFEEFVERLKNNELETDGLKFGALDDDDYDFGDGKDLEYKYKNYILNPYYAWVCEHNHEFIAERVGLDIDACHDTDIIDYTITLTS